MVIDITVEGDFEAQARLSSLGRELVGWYRVLPNEVVDKINKLLEDKVRNDSLDTIGADGKHYRDLEKPYSNVKWRQVRSTEADLHYGYRRKSRAFDGFSIEREGLTNTSKARFNRGGGEYMLAHQTGVQSRAKGGDLPQRKFFPDSQDFNGPHYEKFRDEVRDILIDYLDSLIQRSLNG